MGEKPFAEVLKHAPVKGVEATLVRCVPLLALASSTAVDFLFTSGKANRFNPGGVPCVYFSEDDATARAEYERHHLLGREPFVTYFAEVRLRRVLDLTLETALREVGLNQRDLRAPWVGVPRPTAAQRLGEAVARGGAVAAIRVPSDAARSRGVDGANLVIFRDCVREPDSVRILGPTQKPLQQWP